MPSTLTPETRSAHQTGNQVDNPSLLFLRKFFQQGRRIASIAPSSRSVCAAACRYVSAHHPQTIIELGAGTGPITQEICRKMHPESQLLALEQDPDLAAFTAKLCPRAKVLCADVMNLPEILPAHHIQKFDLIVSGLPTPSLPQSVNRAVFDTLQQFSPGAWFSQLTVMPWVYWNMYKKIFRKVDFDLVIRNVPPGGIYHCHFLKPDYQLNLPGQKPKPASSSKPTTPATEA